MDKNTPMMNALSKKVELPGGLSTITYNKSVLQKETTIYWLAYLLKKLHQQDKEGIFKMKLHDKYKAYEVGIRSIMSKRIQKMAEE